jgi:ribosomal protein S6--L-glutamate ligase
MKKKFLNIVILSRNEKLYSTKRLKEAALALGHSVHVVDYLQCYMNVREKFSPVHYKGSILKTPDAIIPRIGARRTFYGTAILRQFETMGIYTINRSIAITRSRDKLRSLQLLSRKGIALPTTGFAHAHGNIQDLMAIVGGPPFIIKLIEGTQGIGVVLVETEKTAESVLQAMLELRGNLIVQEYIKEAEGADIRCFVIGDKVVAAMKRQAKPGEFRSNVHRGGSAQEIKITKAERELAVSAAKIMGLQLAGVDLLRSSRGPLVIEINSSPGLEGIEAATGKDIATLIIQHMESHAKPIGPRTRYEG